MYGLQISARHVLFKLKCELLRCRQREKQGVKLRKTAEKLLLAHLKKHALDTVQAENALASQKKKTPVKGKKKDALPQARVSCLRILEESRS